MQSRGIPVSETPRTSFGDRIGGTARGRAHRPPPVFFSFGSSRTHRASWAGILDRRPGLDAGIRSISPALSDTRPAHWRRKGQGAAFRHGDQSWSSTPRSYWLFATPISMESFFKISSTRCTPRRTGRSARYAHRISDAAEIRSCISLPSASRTCRPAANARAFTIKACTTFRTSASRRCGPTALICTCTYPIQCENATSSRSR